MSELAQMKCTACRGDEPTLTDAEIEELKPQVPEWQIMEREGVKRLERAFRFKSLSYSHNGDRNNEIKRRGWRGSGVSLV